MYPPASNAGRNGCIPILGRTPIAWSRRMVAPTRFHATCKKIGRRSVVRSRRISLWATPIKRQPHPIMTRGDACRCGTPAAAPFARRRDGSRLGLATPPLADPCHRPRCPKVRQTASMMLLGTPSGAVRHLASRLLLALIARGAINTPLTADAQSNRPVTISIRYARIHGRLPPNPAPRVVTASAANRARIERVSL